MGYSAYYTFASVESSHNRQFAGDLESYIRRRTALMYAVTS